MRQQPDLSCKPKRISGLDGLRGIAILGVIGYHLAPGLFPGGFLGVNLFFILSGYLMAVTSRRAQARHSFHALAFYRRRARRIYPALVLCVCAALCAARLLTPDVLAGIRGEVISIFTGVNNWWQIAQNASYFTKITGTSPFTHLWSLAIEMQFYLVWPLLFWLYTALERRPGVGAVVWALLIAVSVLALFLNIRPGEDSSRVYYGSDTRFFALLIGGLAGLWPQSKPARPTRRGGLYASAFLLLLVLQVLLYLTADGQQPQTYRLLLFPSAVLGAALVLLCADYRFVFGKLLDLPPLSWLGQRSYELYLVQYPILFFVQRAQPFSWQFGNTLLALLLILLVGTWMAWMLSQTQTRKRREPSPHEKTPWEPDEADLPAVGRRRDSWRCAGIPDRARAENQ